MDTTIEINKHAPVDARLTGAAYIIYATNFERKFLLAHYAGYPIQEEMSVVSFVGQFAGEPVNIKVTFVKVFGKYVVFYHPVSKVVHWDVIMRYWKEFLSSIPHGIVDKFHLCLEALRK